MTVSTGARRRTQLVAGAMVVGMTLTGCSEEDLSREAGELVAKEVARAQKEAGKDVPVRELCGAEATKAAKDGIEVGGIRIEPNGLDVESFTTACVEAAEKALAR